MKHALLLCPAALLILAACHKSEQKVAEETPLIDVALPETGSVVLTKTFPGYLSADKTVDIVARVNGYLRQVCYTDGQFVRRGDVLFRIEDTAYRDAVTQAEAALNTARAELEYNTKNFDAMTRALESDAVSRISVSQAESAMKTSEADVRNAEAALRSARTTLGYCEILAPFDGHVTASTVDVGTYLAGEGAAETLATIYADSRLKAQFNVAEAAYVNNLTATAAEQGLDLHAVPLSFADSLNHAYTANLYYIAPDVDTATGTLAMSAEVDNPYGELKAGMFTNISLPYDRAEDAIMVKTASISTGQAGKYLYTLNDSNQVVYTPIKIGDEVRDSMTIVTSGLTPRTRYVTRAMLKVRDGMTVKPHEVK